MLKRILLSIYAFFVGAGGEDWTEGKALPAALRAIHGRRRTLPAKLHRCPCGLLHDHPRELCRNCVDAEAARRPKVLSLRRAAGR